jgi:hypothetical protein
VSPESALVAAVIIAVCAVVAAGSAVLIVRSASRSRVALVRRREPIGHAEVQASRVAAETRDRLERTIVAMERMRVDGASWDDDMQRVTRSLEAQRAGIEGMAHGRLAGFIRMAHLVSKAAQFAFLWR